MKRFRRWLANKLAGWARRIYPQSEEVLSFYADRIVEASITGQSWIKVSAIDPREVDQSDASNVGFKPFAR